MDPQDGLRPSASSEDLPCVPTDSPPLAALVDTAALVEADAPVASSQLEPADEPPLPPLHNPAIPTRADSDAGTTTPLQPTQPNLHDNNSTHTTNGPLPPLHLPHLDTDSPISPTSLPSLGSLNVLSTLHGSPHSLSYNSDTDPVLPPEPSSPLRPTRRAPSRPRPNRAPPSRPASAASISRPASAASISRPRASPTAAGPVRPDIISPDFEDDRRRGSSLPPPVPSLPAPGIGIGDDGDAFADFDIDVVYDGDFFGFPETALFASRRSSSWQAPPDDDEPPLPPDSDDPKTDDSKPDGHCNAVQEEADSVPELRVATTFGPSASPLSSPFSSSFTSSLSSRCAATPNTATSGSSGASGRTQASKSLSTGRTRRGREPRKTTYKKKPEEKQLSYAGYVHCWHMVLQHFDSGVIASHKLAGHLKKVCLAKQRFAKDIFDANNALQKKADHTDHMASSLNGFEAVTRAMGNMAAQEQLFATKVMSEVVDKMFSASNVLEIRKSEIMAEERSRCARLKSAWESLQKAREAALQAIAMRVHWENVSAKQAKKQADPHKPGNLFSKLQDKITDVRLASKDDLKSKSHEAALNYQTKVQQYNREQNEYYTKHLPRLLSQIEVLDAERLADMKKLLSTLCDLHYELTQPNQAGANTLKEHVASINGTFDLARFVAKILTTQGEFQPPAPFEYNLAVRLEEVRENKEVYGGCFGVSLLSLMECQKETHPELTIPLVVDGLVEAMNTMGTDSIDRPFLQDTSQEDMDDHRRQMKAGAQIDVAWEDGYMPAALLQEWLRQLPEPFIPHELYDACLDVVRVPFDYDGVLALFKKLPELHQAVLESILNFLAQVLCNQPATNVNLDDMARVLFPALIRGSEQPMEQLTNAKDERLLARYLVRMGYETVAKAATTIGI